MRLLKKLWREEEGQGMTEYGLIIALISIAVITVLGLFGGKLKEIFQKIVDTTIPA